MSAEQWHLDRCGSAVVDGQTVPACHLGEETAHDPRVALTEAEADRLSYAVYATDCTFLDVTETVERIIAARLDRVRAVAEQWDTGCAREVLAALDAPQDAPRGPVGGEQGHDGAECRHEDVRTFRSVPPHSKCLDCGLVVEQRWIAGRDLR